jgi:hypothetical protein
MSSEVRRGGPFHALYYKLYKASYLCSVFGLPSTLPLGASRTDARAERAAFLVLRIMASVFTRSGQISSWEDRSDVQCKASAHILWLPISLGSRSNTSPFRTQDFGQLRGTLWVVKFHILLDS